MLSKKHAMLYATGAFAVFIAVLSVFALTSYTFVQNNTVPSTEIILYERDGTTPLTNNADLSGLWTWNETQTKFELTVVVKNSGTTNINTTVSSSDVPSGWAFSYDGTGSLLSGDTQTVTLTLSNVNAVEGQSTEDWHWTIVAT
jgi:hypothetical protein